MRAYSFETYDVFTDKRFSGNQLAVVFGADDLTTDEMQIITREFNLSETTFLLAPEDPENTARVRIFTLGYEMPFAGHPTVGASVALARRANTQGAMALELNAGLFPVVTKEKKGIGFAEFQNPTLPFEVGPAPSAEIFEAALSLPSGSIDKTHHQPRCMSAGVSFLYAKAPLEAVRSAKLNTAKWADLGIDNTVGVYLYAEGGETPGATYHARMFAPDAGILEDPATGSAAAALPGQIAASHIAAGQPLNDGEHLWIIEQGFEMGRPSLIHAMVQSSKGEIESVRIGGNAVHVQSGEIFI